MIGKIFGNMDSSKESGEASKWKLILNIKNMKPTEILKSFTSGHHEDALWRSIGVLKSYFCQHVHLVTGIDQFPLRFYWEMTN